MNDYETERNERRQMVLLGMVESEYGLDYVDGEDPGNESEYVLDYIYIDGEGQVMNLNIGCIRLIEKFQVKIIRADNFRIVS